MAFGPESTNPRERRAYAHAIIQKAIETGTPEDSRNAIECALDAGHTQKGKTLPKVALNSIVNAYLYEGVIRTVSPPKETRQEVLKPSWMPQAFVESLELAAKVLGGMAGVEIYKPTSPKEYAEAAESMVSPDTVSFGQYNNHSVVSYDFSVPGTAYLADVASAIRTPRVWPPLNQTS